MADETHEVVKLLLARMESHPEEFRVANGSFHNRWYDSINGIHAHGNEADKTAIAAKLRDIRMGEIHEQVMDELLNGPERRRKYEEDREYERHLEARQLLTSQQMAQQAQQYAQAGGASLPVGIGPYQNAVASRQYYDAATDTYNLGNGLKLTSEQVKDNPGLVATMKKALGL